MDTWTGRARSCPNRSCSRSTFGRSALRIFPAYASARSPASGTALITAYKSGEAWLYLSSLMIALLAASAAGRSVISKMPRAHARDEGAARWGRRSVAGVAVHACCWGCVVLIPSAKRMSAAITCGGRLA